METQPRRLLGLLDLTSLNEADDAAAIARLCARATTPFGNVAAVCVWPRFAPLCRERLRGSGVRVSTVVNFPHGGADVAGTRRETEQAILAGADEVDIVFPYRCWLAGDRDRACRLVEVCKQACGTDVILKVILETGELPTPAHIAAISRDAIQAGADFLKTSTGKVKTGATLAAATVMLAAIKEAGAPVGFKAAGGVRAVRDALSYLTLAEGVMGDGWARPATFRIGASALLDELLHELYDDAAASGNHPPQA